MGGAEVRGKERNPGVVVAMRDGEGEERGKTATEAGACVSERDAVLRFLFGLGFWVMNTGNRRNPQRRKPKQNAVNGLGCSDKFSLISKGYFLYVTV